MSKKKKTKKKKGFMSKVLTPLVVLAIGAGVYGAYYNDLIPSASSDYYLSFLEGSTFKSSRRSNVGHHLLRKRVDTKNMRREKIANLVSEVGVHHCRSYLIVGGVAKDRGISSVEFTYEPPGNLKLTATLERSLNLPHLQRQGLFDAVEIRCDGFIIRQSLISKKGE